MFNRMTGLPRALLEYFLELLPLLLFSWRLRMVTRGSGMTGNPIQLYSFIILNFNIIFLGTEIRNFF